MVVYYWSHTGYSEHIMTLEKTGTPERAIGTPIRVRVRSQSISIMVRPM